MSLKGAGGGEREGVGATGGGVLIKPASTAASSLRGWAGLEVEVGVGGCTGIVAGSAELRTRLKSAGSVSSGGSLALQAAGAIV